MNRIREIRELNSVKQVELANALQVSQGTLSNWERGAHDPDNVSLIKLADYFGVTTDYLLGRTVEPVPSGGKNDDINLDEIEFALYGEVRELGDEEKEELLGYARKLRRLLEFEKAQEKDDK